MQVSSHGDQYYQNHLKLVPFDELLYYVLTPMVIAIVFIYTVPADFESFIPLGLLFKVGTALSHSMDVQYYSTSGYNENYCKAAGIIKTFWFDACVLCLTCYVVMFRHKLNYRSDPMTYKAIPVHHFALAFICIFSGLHAFFSQDVIVANRINQKEAMQTMFNFYKSNTCISFGKKHESEHFGYFDKVLSIGPTIFLIVTIVPILINNRNLVQPENQGVFELESLKPYIFRHYILIAIVLSDLVFDSIFNIWIDLLGTKLMSTRTIGRLCQLILLIHIYLLIATYRLNNTLEVQGVKLLSNKQNPDGIEDQIGTQGSDQDGDTYYQTVSQPGGGGTTRLQQRKPVGQLFQNTVSPEQLVYGKSSGISDNSARSAFRYNRGLEPPKMAKSQSHFADIERDQLQLRTAPIRQQITLENEQKLIPQQALPNQIFNKRLDRNSSSEFETPKIKDNDQEVKGQIISSSKDNLIHIAQILQDIWKKKNDAMKMLVQYTKTINNTMQREGQQDLQFFAKLEQLQDEASDIHSDLKNKENRIYQLEQTKSEMDRQLNQMEIQNQNYQIDDLNEFHGRSQLVQSEVSQMRQSIVKTEAFLQHRNQEFTQLKTELIPKGKLLDDIKKTQTKIDQNFGKINPYLEGYPNLIHQTLHSLTEVSADSNVEKDKIRKQLSELNRINQMHPKLAEYFKNLYTMSFNNSLQTKISPISQLQQELDQLKQLLQEQQAKIREVHQNQEQVDSIRLDLAERQIPRSIKARQDELQGLKKRLEGNHQKFREILNTHCQMDLEMSTDNIIQNLIEDIQIGLDEANGALDNLMDHYKKKFEQVTKRGIPSSSDNQSQLIRDIKDFKIQIQEFGQNIDKLNKPLYDLQTKYVEYGIQESANLANFDFEYMRERVTSTETALNQNLSCAKQMDGNTSDDNEEYLIDGFKRDIPEHIKQLKNIRKDIKTIEDSVKSLQKKKDIKKIKAVKQKIKDTDQSIAEFENRASQNKLNIVQWNAMKKLCKRDKELYEIDANLKVLEQYFQMKNLLIHKENLQIKQKIQCIHNGFLQDPQGQKKQNLMDILPQISQFSQNVDQLIIEVIKLKDLRQKTFTEFNAKIPNDVKEDRLKRSRLQNDSQTNIQIEIQSFKMDADSVNEIPNDTYYMIDVSCKFRKTIKDMEMQVHHIYQKQMDVTEIYANLQDKIASIGATKFYKPSKGDLVDECFAQYINSAEMDLTVKKVQPGRYQFGTRQIMVTLINESLLIRVGGGYMKPEQFIQKYGPIEIHKLKKQKETGDNRSAYSGSGSRSPNNPRSVGSNPDIKIGIGEIRQWMKQELRDNPNIKPAELQRRIKQGILLNSDGSSEIDPVRDQQLANLEISSIEQIRLGGDISSKNSTNRIMRPCHSANQLKLKSRQKSQDMSGTIQLGAMKNQRIIDASRFNSGNIHNTNQDLTSIIGYDTKLESGNYAEKPNLKKKKQMHQNFSEQQLHLRKAALRYGRDDFKSTTPTQIQEHTTDFKNRTLQKKDGVATSRTVSEDQSNNKSIKSKSQNRNLNHYQMMLLENTSSTISKNSRGASNNTQKKFQASNGPPIYPQINSQVKQTKNVSKNGTPRSNLAVALDNLKQANQASLEGTTSNNSHAKRTKATSSKPGGRDNIDSLKQFPRGTNYPGNFNINSKYN